ncbi:hypothetical protein ACDL92_03780 [Ihubacter sp. mB4P-1]|uniref:hypothetical protein n=1 Tax=Ihubacter sp. mB4P-1 TaxID=3242370 RepID=UPI003C7CB1F4
MKSFKKIVALTLSMSLVAASGMLSYASVPEEADIKGVQQDQLFCGETEHVHVEDCYENGELTCTLKEHTHNDACYQVKENVSLDQEDVESNDGNKQGQPGSDEAENEKSDHQQIEPAEDQTIYVSAEAGDSTAVKGSKENPYATLAEAVNAVNNRVEKDAVIEILSDLTANAYARIDGKDVTIKGNGHTISRGDNFAMASDPARSWYNPAMIEVCDSSHSVHASLRLENITLTDSGKTAGERYSQATTDGKGGNDDTVQDGIIATYDGVADITLGQGTTIDGYGGMSAVRLSGGRLVMESGSMISGGKTFTTKGGGNGAAGAVWIQGGSLVMEEGSEISEIEGRAVYLDGAGSYALVNGTIRGVKPNGNMWQGSDGTAMHVRNESSAVLGTTGEITDIEGGIVAISIISSSFTAQENSEISAIKNTRIANANGAKEEDKNPHIVLFDGTVKDCTYDDVQFWAWYARYIVGPHAVIENTTASKKTIGMFYLQNGGELDVQGKIQNNNNTVVYMGNQGGGGTVVRVKEGAYIHGNQGYGVYANNSGHVEMSGGEISENTSYGIYVRCKSNWKDANLTMTGGKIINNGSSGVYFMTCADSKYGLVNITGGEISGNGSDYAPYQIYVSGAYGEDAVSRVFLKDGVVQAANGREAMVNTSFGKLSAIEMDESNTDLYLGNGKSAASNVLKNLAAAYKTDAKDVNSYTTKGSALWFKAQGEKLSFQASRPSKYTVNYALPLYVAYIPVKADGTPEVDAKMTVKKVSNTDSIVVELKELTPEQSYVLMWMQPTEKFGTLLIEGTPELSEELGVTDYTVDYTATYTLSKDISGLVDAGDTFNVIMSLDKNLSYDGSKEEGQVKLKENDALELAGDPVYNKEKNTLTVTLKVKDGFDSKNKSYSAVITFKAESAFEAFPEGSLSTDGVVKGSVILSGESEKTAFTLRTGGAYETALTPLPIYTISYDDGTAAGEEAKVKEGTALTADLAEGSWNVELPDTVTQDMLMPNPTRAGYTFSGWQVTHGSDGISIIFTARWTDNSRPPVVRPEEPTTPVDPPIIDDPDVPLGPDPGIDDPIIDDPDVPLSPGTDLPKDDHLNGDYSEKADPDQPKTGDHAPLAAMTGILALSAGLLGAMCFRRKEN